MRKVEVFEGSVCCGGACGGQVNEDSVRVSNKFVELTREGKVEVAHHDLQQDPYSFLANTSVAAAVQTVGIPALPLTTVDEVIVKMGEYPTNEELDTFASVDFTPVNVFDPSASDCACGHACSCSGEDAEVAVEN